MLQILLTASLSAVRTQYYYGVLLSQLVTERFIVVAFSIVHVVCFIEEILSELNSWKNNWNFKLNFIRVHFLLCYVVGRVLFEESLDRGSLFSVLFYVSDLNKLKSRSIFVL